MRLVQTAGIAAESSIASTVGKYAVGGAETILGGVYNYAVRVAGGVVSVPFLLDSAEAAAAVQEGFMERAGYNLRSQGARDIGAALQPVAQFVQNDVLTPLRDYSTAHIGDAATSTIFAGAQAGVEIGGLLLTGGALGASERVVAGAGLRTSTLVSAERAQQFLVKNGVAPKQAALYVAELEGPITARLVRPGEDFLRYFDAPKDSGNFLTTTRFADPAEAVGGLNLGPYGNTASQVQAVTSTSRSIVLEAGIRNGGAGARQTLISQKNAFYFGPGSTYP